MQRAAAVPSVIAHTSAYRKGKLYVRNHAPVPAIETSADHMITFVSEQEATFCTMLRACCRWALRVKIVTILYQAMESSRASTDRGWHSLQEELDLTLGQLQGRFPRHRITSVLQCTGNRQMATGRLLILEPRIRLVQYIQYRYGVRLLDRWA